MERVFIQALSALQAMHAHRIYHGDISPAKVLIDSHGNLKLTDIGLARAISQVNLKIMTYAFQSFEKLSFDIDDWASDVYSLCATFYFVFSKRWPNVDEGYWPKKKFIRQRADKNWYRELTRAECPSQKLRTAINHNLMAAEDNRQTAEQILEMLIGGNIGQYQEALQQN